MNSTNDNSGARLEWTTESVQDHVKTLARTMNETLYVVNRKKPLTDIEYERYEFNHRLLTSMGEQMEMLRHEPLTIRVSQLRGLSRIGGFLSRGGNAWNAGRIRQPTGAGKTVLYGLTGRLLNQGTSIFVPKSVLLEQTKEELVDVVGIPEDSIGLVGDKHDDIGKEKQFLIGNYQTHLRRMGRDAKYSGDLLSRRVIVCDEAHRSLGKQTREALRALGLPVPGKRPLDPTQRLFLGFTATTELINKSVSDSFPELIAEENYAELVEAGILVNFKIVPADETIIYEGETVDMNEKKEIEILHREGVYTKLISKFVETRRNAPEPLYPVVGCVNHNECLRYAKESEAFGLRSMIVTSYERSADRDIVKKAENALLRGEVDQIITVDLLTEGWNFKPANSAIVARAGQSPARYIQFVGRTSRAYDGWNDAEYGSIIHTPYRKSVSYVFESSWKVRQRPVGDESALTNEEKERRMRDRVAAVGSATTPIDLTGAVSLFGENPDEFISRADGKKVVRKERVELKDGIGEWQGEAVTTLGAYAKNEKNGIGFRTLLHLVGESTRFRKIASIPHLFAKGRGETAVYRAVDLDLLISDWLIAEKEKAAAVARRQEEETIPWHDRWPKLDVRSDTAVLDGRVVIGREGILGLNPFKEKQFELDALERWLQRRKIEPVKQRFVRMRADVAKGGVIVRAFDLEGITAQFSTIQNDTFKLSPGSCDVAISEENGRVAVGLKGIQLIASARGRAIHADHIALWLKKKRITNVPYRIVESHDSLGDPILAPAFWKDLIEQSIESLMEFDVLTMHNLEAVILEKDSENGYIVRLESNVRVERAFDVETFAKKSGTDKAVLHSLITDAVLRPLISKPYRPDRPIYRERELIGLLSATTGSDGTIAVPVGKEEDIMTKSVIEPASIANLLGLSIDDVKKRLQEKLLSPAVIDGTLNTFVLNKAERHTLQNRSVVRTVRSNARMQTWVLLTDQAGGILARGAEGDSETYWLSHVEKAFES